MRKIHFALILSCGFSLTLAILWITMAQNFSAKAAPENKSAIINLSPLQELRVCQSGCAHSALQSAVDAANEGDIIKVAAGVYTGVNNYAGLSQVVYLSKTLTLQGGYSTTDWTTSAPETNLTSLDAEGQGRVFYITGDIQPTIEGFRITGGEASALGGLPPQPEWDLGGGILVITATPKIKNNVVISNTCSSELCNGGGIAVLYSDAIISENTFQFNSTGWGGGAFWSGWSSSTVNANTFTANQAKEGGAAEIHIDSGTFSNNLIISNSAESGGGLSSHIGTEKIFNNVFTDNTASNTGSGLTISGSSPQLLHNTIARNQGGDNSGISVIQSFFGYYSNASLTNTILVDHSVGISVTGGNTVTVNSVLWYDTPITITKSITAAVNVQNDYMGDPVFASDGYHLLAGSAAVDRGVDTGIMLDIDGEPRPAGTAFDLGADEIWYQIYLPGITNNYQE